jgi:O-antigen biosynthesis protein
VGWVNLPVVDGHCPAALIRETILNEHGGVLLMHTLQNRLARVPAKRWQDNEPVYQVLSNRDPLGAPRLTVAVCTRNRTGSLRQCLDALQLLDYTDLDLLVVDNAPDTQETADLVKASYPGVRYVREERPGLNWARNRAVLEACGDIIAFTDDDVIVDPHWASAIAAIFTQSPEVMAVTGLVVPHELETEAQNLFELYGGFGRGFKRKWTHRADYSGKKHLPFGCGQFGTGANMAYRRSLFDSIGLFDPALDVGTVTNGGGDLEMFFRVVKEGHVLVYEPRAIVRHRHRPDLESLKTQIRNNGIGFYAFLVRSAIAYPEEKYAIARFGAWWFCWWSLRRLLLSFCFSMRFPRKLIWAELTGSIIGLGRYFKARKTALKIASSASDASAVSSASDATPGALDSQNRSIQALALKSRRVPKSKPAVSPQTTASQRTAVRTLNLDRPLRPIDDINDVSVVHIYVMNENTIYGSMTLKNHGRPLCVPRLLDALVDTLGLRLLGSSPKKMSYQLAGAKVALYRRFMLPVAQPPPQSQPQQQLRLADEVSVCVVLATYDRPDSLRECLQSLVEQKTSRPIRIVVVDNHPASGLTAPVVAAFPGVLRVDEQRRGLSCARNTGIAHRGTADIVVTTDDDVIAPSDWIEKLVAPFARHDVLVVTGNILPHTIDTHAQLLFEMYGGLGRGFDPIEAGPEWFESFHWDAVPTWRLGATANAAFRAVVFTHPAIGLFDEMLGAGTPTGCSEDTLVFYNVLKNGYTIKYEPAAYVRHKHRSDMRALQNQIYNYSKGHVAYHLLIFARHRDFRSLFRICLFLPYWQARQLYRYLKSFLKRRPGRYPLRLIWCEIRGTLAGPWALWRAWRRVRRLVAKKSRQLRAPQTWRN